MMKKIFVNSLYLRIQSLIMVFFLAFLISCDWGSSSSGGGGDSNRITNPTDGVQNPPSVNFAPSASAKWTIMVYLDGDNDLEPFALLDFQEMKTGMAALGAEAGDPSQYINLIVMIDRIPGYSNAELEGENFTDTRYFKITKDGATRLDDGGTGDGHVANLGEKNMGDPATLTAFIDYCNTYHSADHYALILWNHGSGARSSNLDEPLAVKDTSFKKSLDKPMIIGSAQKGVKAICDDETDGDILYIDEVQQAIADSSITKLDIIGFDACLMGTIEVAYEFRDLADYMVGSMNLEWGNGWDYNRLFSGMTGNSSDAKELAKLMVKQYRDSTSTTSSETQSATDLSKIAALKTAVDAFAVKLAAENKKSRIETTRDLSYNFYTSDVDSINYPYYDLGDFAYQISTDTGYSEDLKNSAETVITKLSETVVSAYANTGFGNYYGTGAEVKRGLSIFFSRGNLTYWDDSHYAYQWWYTSRNIVFDYGTDFEYGRIDFCDFNDNGSVETWKELMEYYYNPGGTASADTF